MNVWAAGPGVLLALAAMLGCGETRAKTGQPRGYEHDGLSFEYPGAWEVSADVEDEAVRYVLLESPGEAILLVQVYPAAEAMGLEAFAAAFSESALEEPHGAGIGVSSFGKVEMKQGMEGLAEYFTVRMDEQSLPHTRHYRRYPAGDRVCFLIGQAPDEEEAEMIEGFHLVFSSFGYDAP